MNNKKLLQIDEQTLADLRLFGQGSSRSVYEIFNQTSTHGGEILLEQMFRHPLSDITDINNRIALIRQFAEQELAFPFEAASFDMAEKYLGDAGSGEMKGQHNWNEKDLQQGATAVLTLLQQAKQFVSQSAVVAITAYTADREEITALVEKKELLPALKEPLKGKLSYAVLTAYDALFRSQERSTIKRLLEKIYQLDVYLAVAKVAVMRRFVFPTVLNNRTSMVKLSAVYHPCIDNAVGNDIVMGEEKNLLFLTGANMAGKSTFLRSLATALYLAHMGFPVAAAAMEFTVMDGIYTTINLPDNLGIGASHFYAEVLRIKQLALELEKGKALFVIFDELFRGTNVKDAHEATVATTRAFASRNNSLFVISSHIVEAGEELAQVPAVSFSYLPTKMNGHIPAYTYRLEPGITGDRHGMIIIRNAGILDILKKGRKLNLQ
jgi:DNA mismatch repair protein MutS